MFDVVSVLIMSVFLFMPPVLPTEDNDPPICNAPVFANTDGDMEPAPCTPPEPKSSPAPTRKPRQPA